MPKSTEASAEHSKQRQRPPAIMTLATPLLAAALLGAYASPATAYQATVRSARTLSGTATAHLHLIEAEGSKLIEDGPVTGALTGSARAELHTGAVFTATFTIQTSRGSITGEGRATPHGSGRYQSFSGSFHATHGSGRYAHIKGQAGLYGVFDVRTDSVVIQTTDGTLSY
jgi:hypothetical protein